jgi:hypothetical protein
MDTEYPEKLSKWIIKAELDIVEKLLSRGT